MQLRLFKLRFRKQLRQSQQQVEDIGLQAEAGLERHLFKRLGNLASVWRFVAGWLLLCLLLIGGLIAQLLNLNNHYQSLQPVPGGSFSEGIVGQFTNANPIFATSETDSVVSHLLFSGLLKYDTKNQLVGDLASDYNVDDKGLVYTVHLKPNLVWQDGKPITADDVVFTYQAIQNPDAQSPLAANWQNIVVAKKDARTVTFTLPNPLSSFASTLTNGIVPAHSLQSLPPTDWRSADFNTVHPVGAGPFAWNALQVLNNGNTSEVLIALKPSSSYHAGTPKLSSFVIHTFADDDSMQKAFRAQRINAMSLGTTGKKAHDKQVNYYNFTETAANMVFFNEAMPELSDAAVRRALVQSANIPKMLAQLSAATRPVTEPFLRGQSVFDPSLAQAKFDLPAAQKIMQQAGYILNTKGQFEKNGKALSFTLDATDTPEYRVVTRELHYDWRQLGVDIQVQLHDEHDFQSIIDARNYQALLYGISIGTDPDVFVYWDSSQTDPRSTRLNFSNYKSATADAALEAGRTRLDPALRTIKYHPFLQDWQQNAPALGLYQPRFLYVTRQPVYGLQEHTINTATDRYSDVQNWMIRTAKVTNN